MKFYLTAAITVLSVGLLSCQGKMKKEDLKTQQEKVSYTIGLNIGKDMKKNGIEVDPKFLLEGIKNGLAEKALLSDSECNVVMTQFQQEYMAKQAEKMKGAASGNKAAGEKFLAENKTKEGVITTASGLQYKVISSGSGKTPTASSTVVTHYRGTLLDGKEFDSSYKRGQPAEFPVNGVIRGWTEALQLMKEGDKWMLYIPSDLAYGDQGAGETIPPGSTLIFEIELITVK